MLDSDIFSLANSFISYWHDNSKLIDKIYIAMKDIGAPAHYSTICKKYNSLFPKHKNEENNIHSALLRGKSGIVWIGAKGMFALTEWGFKRPENTLLRTAAIIVEQRYAQSRKAVPYDFVVNEFKKHRKFINESSLKMSLYNNPELVLAGYESFLPKNTNDISQEYIDDRTIILIPQNFEGSPLNNESSQKLQEFIINSSLLDELTYREREIVKLRNGVDTTHFHTYEEIGRVFRTSIARVHEVEEKAIGKLLRLSQNST